MGITEKIARPYYLEWIDSWKDKDIIKVVSGIRRTGKTTLLELFREKSAEIGIAKENIISINFEDPEIDAFSDYRAAWKFIRSKFPASGKAYVFLDEIQLVPDFEKVVDGLFAKKDCDVYITGSNAKYYIDDPDFRWVMLGDKRNDFGHLLENIVYLELTRRYRNVYVGMMGKQEVDFVALTNGEPHYYQVALSVRDENTLARELAPLEAIRDHHPKTLLTLDPDPPFNHNGIKQINVIDFLLSPV